MSEDQPSDTSQADSEGERQGVGGLFYKVALAGVGGVMLAQEELVNLLRPGRKAEKTDADEAEVGGAEAGEVDASDDAPTGPTGVEATIDRVLHTLHLPSRADTEALTLAVDDLERRIETLRRQRGA